MRLLPLHFSILLLAFCCSSVLAQTTASADLKNAAFNNPALSTDKRLDDLISRMTLEEKVSQMNNSAAAVPRLGIPPYDWWSECLHGVGINGIATVFPQAIGLGATWDEDLVFHVATATSDEARAKHHEAVRHGDYGRFKGLTFWSPNINIFRDPRWGRGQETYGEDPYLTSRLGVEFVKGLQGDDPKYLKLVSTPKHFAVHSGPEPLRHQFDAKVSDQDLYETYLPHFEACVQEAKAFSIMCAYNSVNGEPCCSNDRLQQQILRDEWGFEGYIVSDCGAIDDIYRGHKVAKTAEEAAARAVKAGCDLCCGETYSALVQAVHDGMVSESVINRALHRLFRARFRLGMFDPPENVKWAQIPFEVVDSLQNRKLAADAARKSIVLLKNEKGLLPLKKNLPVIAVVGPNANTLGVLLGNYNGQPSKYVTPLEGIMRAVSPQTRVIYAKGSNLLEKSSLQVVPAIALRHTDANGNQTEGLKAEYFNNPKLKGNPDITQSDAKIDFDWQDSAPTKGIHADLFSVRWSGQLLPTVTGKYELGFSSDDGFRLTLDGKTRIEDWSIHAAQTTSTEVELEAGKSYDLKVEYFEQRAGASAKLLWAPPQATDVLLNQAVDAARQADVVIAVLGISPEVEGETHDREDINLPPVQQELLHALYDTGKPVVAVLLSGSALAVNWADAHIPAILQAWYPGEEGGTAIADVIFGDYNPAGRMPITAYKSLDQVPEFKDYDVAKGRTYRYFSGEPLYPFGYGLSYSSFDYSDLKIEPASLSSPTTVTVSAEIRNVGKVAGEEVPQLYLKNSTAPDAHALTPLHHLEGFKRVYLNPGETKTVSFQLTPKQYAIVNSEGKHVLATGKVQVYVGGGQPDQVSHGSKTLNGQFEMTGESQILQ